MKSKKNNVGRIRSDKQETQGEREKQRDEKKNVGRVSVCRLLVDGA